MKNDKRNKIIVMSIMSYYAKQIFDETKSYEFRKSPLRKEDLDKKIYVYSAKEDKAIIGYMKVSDILYGNTQEILRKTGYDKRKDGHEIIDYYGLHNNNCYALKLYDVTEFEEYLKLKDLRKLNPSVNLPQYYSYINQENPLYELITEWDKCYSLDGQEKQNPAKVRELLKNGRRR